MKPDIKLKASKLYATEFLLVAYRIDKSVLSAEDQEKIADYIADNESESSSTAIGDSFFGFLGLVAFNVSEYLPLATQLIVATGGFAGLAKIVVTYLTLKHQTRKITITDNDNRKIEIEATSLEEVERLLATAKAIEIGYKREEDETLEEQEDKVE